MIVWKPVGGQDRRKEIRCTRRSAHIDCRLTAEMTMTDPKFYTPPVVATKRWVEVPNAQLLPYECTAETWYERIEDLAQKARVPMP
jgi:hypothetical protein